MNKRIEWIDTTKVVTMILVVLGHSAYYNISTSFGGIHYLSDEGEISLTYEVLKKLVKFIYTFHMPLFMALSGMCFFISRSKDANICQLLKDKAIRLLLPFVAVSLFLVIPFKYSTGYWLGSENVLADIFLGQILLLGNSHLWFIFSLFWIFLLFYVFRKVIKNEYIYWAVLLLLSWVGRYIEHRISCFGLPGAFKHLFFFSVGYYSLNYLSRTKYSISHLIFLLVSFVVTFILFEYIFKPLIGVNVSRILSPLFFIFYSIIGGFVTIEFSKLLSPMRVGGGGCLRTQFDKNDGSKMIGKTTNIGNNCIGPMNNDAKLRLNSDTLHPENSVNGVLGRPGGG